VIFITTTQKHQDAQLLQCSVSI